MRPGVIEKPRGGRRPVSLAGLDRDLLLTEERLAVVPAAHPLAERVTLSPADLDGEPVARWPHLPEELDHFYRGGAPGEPAPSDQGVDVGGLAEALRMVELGRAITFLPTSVVAMFARPGIRAVPFPGLAPSSLVVAWRPASTDPVLATFVRACAQWGEAAGSRTRPR